MRRLLLLGAAGGGGGGVDLRRRPRVSRRHRPRGRQPRTSAPPSPTRRPSSSSALRGTARARMADVGARARPRARRTSGRAYTSRAGARRPLSSGAREVATSGPSRLRARRSGRRCCGSPPTRRSTPPAPATSIGLAPGSSSVSFGRRRASRARPPTRRSHSTRLAAGPRAGGRRDSRSRRPPRHLRRTASQPRSRTSEGHASPASTFGRRCRRCERRLLAAPSARVPRDERPCQDRDGRRERSPRSRLAPPSGLAAGAQLRQLDELLEGFRAGAALATTSASAGPASSIASPASSRSSTDAASPTGG